MTPTEKATPRVRPSDGLYLDTGPGQGCIGTLTVAWLYLYGTGEGMDFLGVVASEVRSLLAGTEAFRRYYDLTHFAPSVETANAGVHAYNTARQACRWAAGRAAEELTPEYGAAFCETARALVIAALARGPEPSGEPMIAGAAIEFIAPTEPPGEVILPDPTPAPPGFRPPSAAPAAGNDPMADVLSRLRRTERRLEAIEGGLQQILDYTRQLDAHLPGIVEQLRRLKEQIEGAK